MNHLFSKEVPIKDLIPNMVIRNIRGNSKIGRKYKTSNENMVHF